MVLETLRMVTDALNHATIGVNAMLVSIPVDTDDVAPAAIDSIVDETRSVDVAVGQLPDEDSSLSVTLAESVTLNGDVMSDNRDGSVSVLIRHSVKTDNVSEGIRDAFYVLRAVQRSLRLFNSNDWAALRVRNEVQVLECTGIEHVRLSEEYEDSIVIGGIRATFAVRDSAP
jgi:hypothetical protein